MGDISSWAKWEWEEITLDEQLSANFLRHENFNFQGEPLALAYPLKPR